MQSEESFLLPVFYKDEEHLLSAELSTRGYIHRIIIEVEGEVVFFEPDEERNYRAVLADTSVKSRLDPAFIRAIVASLEANFKG